MEIELINPLKLFSRNRLDLIVKYLFANEVLERDINSCSVDIYKDLYIRHILMRTKGVTSSLESNQKINVDEFSVDLNHTDQGISTCVSFARKFEISEELKKKFNLQ